MPDESNVLQIFSDAMEEAGIGHGFYCTLSHLDLVPRAPVLLFLPRARTAEDGYDARTLTRCAQCATHPRMTLLHSSFTDSLTNNMYLNVHSHYVKQGALLPGQQNVTQQQFEAIALAQVKKRAFLRRLH